MRLTWLKIHKYPMVHPGTELQFNDGFNILLGQNGSGKTSLLNLIVRILKSDFISISETEFHFEYKIHSDSGHTVKIECQSKPSIQIDGITPSEPAWSYTITTNHATISKNNINSTADFNIFSIFFPSRAITLITQDVDFIMDFLPSKTRYVRIDEGLDLFRQLTEPANDFKSSLIQLVYYKSSGTTGVGSNIFPKQAVSAILSKDKNTNALAQTLSSDDLLFLNRIVKNLGYHSAEIQLQLYERRGDEENSTNEYTHLRFIFHTDRGMITSHDRLSFGEKRLLTFHYCAACCPDVVVADELVNGLHHTWIEDCLDLISDRQSFLTSQNPLLLDYLEFADAEEVRRSFVLCSRPEGRAGPWHWRNMTVEESESVMRAYEVGIQHVSEILRDKGLW